MDPIADAEELIENGDLDTARSICRSLVSVDSVAVEDLVRVGRLFEQMDDSVAAGEAYSKAILVNPQFTLGESFLGLLLFKQGSLTDAIVHLRRAVDLDPQDPANLTVLGVAMLDQGNHDEGIRHLEAALRINPNYEEAHFNMGLAFRRLDPEKAAEHLRAAVNLDGKYCTAYRELGYVLSGLHKLDEAEQALQQAWTCDPSDVWTLIYWGTAKWQSGDVLEAKKKFEAAILLEPELSFPQWSLGTLFEDLGERLQARRCYETALRLNPKDEIAAEKLCNLLANTIPIQ